MAKNTRENAPEKFPIAGLVTDGWSTEDEATATCFCGAVQLQFPTHGPGYAGSFVCNCGDCHKITASMFASNFTVKDTHLKHLRGKENLKIFGPQKTTVESKHEMANYFCSTCGTLMYRVGSAFPGHSIMRIGTVDDFSLMETKLRPQREIYVRQRLNWLSDVHGAVKSDGMPDSWAKL